jgi:glycosyltransferase involved in cell wall biosynthesis
MKIVEIASFEEPIPPLKYGGIELVVHNVTEGLVAAGHEVYLLASGDSHTSAHLVPYLPKSLREMYPFEELSFWRDFHNFYLTGQMVERIKEIKPDIVHNHTGWRLMAFSGVLDCPMISTIHHPLTIRKHLEMFKRFPDANYVSISDSQRKPMQNLNWVGTVYNGIDVTAFEFSDVKQDYFAFLGRVSPEKGLGALVQMFKKTPYKLKIAAKLDPADQAYYETEVKPYIDGEKIQFLGEVDHNGKNELLKNAKASVTWLNRDEPFGLAYTESMACGTPVIINPLGSPSELIVDGKTGFLVNTLSEMEDRLSRIDEIDPRDCRDRVAAHFSQEAMVRGYLRIMESVLSN